MVLRKVGMGLQVTEGGLKRAGRRRMAGETRSGWTMYASGSGVGICGSGGGGGGTWQDIVHIHGPNDRSAPSPVVRMRGDISIKIGAGPLMRSSSIRGRHQALVSPHRWASRRVRHAPRPRKLLGHKEALLLLTNRRTLLG